MAPDAAVQLNETPLVVIFPEDRPVAVGQVVINED
jgi:hypothetical protein